jgi:hypothetical protein
VVAGWIEGALRLLYIDCAPDCGRWCLVFYSASGGVVKCVNIGGVSLRRIVVLGVMGR